MKINNPFIPLIVLAFLTFSCKTTKVDTQGIKGQVFWEAGNQMPLAEEGGKTAEEAKRQPVQRTLRIHELTHITQARLGDALFGNIETAMVEEVQTDEKGRFSVQLPPGRYSIFTVEENGYFANVFDLDSYISPYEVKEGAWTKVEILVNYQGVY